MKIVKTVSEMRIVRRQLRGTIGLVPTMGYLHEGHLSLVRHSRQENDYTVTTIFVNPTQFGPSEDFERYPRDFQRDFAILEKERTDFIFIPASEEMYSEGYNTWVDVCDVTEKLEGSMRPGHFRGVATIVTKLLNIIQPSRVYFGQKDAQQCVVIKKLVTELNMDLEVVIRPTVREPDGLAMSSRNIYLNREERDQAPVLYQALRVAHVMWSEGEMDSSRLRQAMTDLINRKHLAKIEYISVANALDLQELEKATPPAIISLAVKFGKTRLIDNIWLE